MDKRTQTLTVINKKKYDAPYPTIGDIIKGKNYDYVSYRMRFDKEKYKNRLSDDYFEEGIFAGAFKVEGGEIIPLDGDIYYETEDVLESEEWERLTDEGETVNGLTIVVEAELYEPS